MNHLSWHGRQSYSKSIMLSWDGTYPHNFNDKNENNTITFISHQWVCHFPIGILGQVWYLIVSFLIFAPLLNLYIPYIMQY